METATMQMTKNRRSYIERLRHDPRTKALFDSFIYQAIVEMRERRGLPRSGSPFDAEKFALLTAERAVELAMAFVLDNDGEYEMLRQQHEQLLQTAIDLSRMTPGPSIIVSTEPFDEVTDEKH